MRSIVVRSMLLVRPATAQVRPALLRAAATCIPLVGLLTAMRLAEPSGNSLAAVDTSAVASVDWDAPAVLTAEDSLALEAELTRVELRRPLERYFARFTDDRAMVRRVTRAVIREARRQQVAPSLIAAVLITENTTLEPVAQSFVGAQGLMQVMPMHAGQPGCPSEDLVDVDNNICHGTKILVRELQRTRTTAAALLRYNGCVKGTNTPDCHKYPFRVLARAGQLRQQILAANPQPDRLIQLAGR